MALLNQSNILLKAIINIASKPTGYN